MGAIADAYTAVQEHLHALIAQLEEEGHRLAEAIRKDFETLHGKVPAVEHEAAADAAQVAHDAKSAAAPVVAEAEHDVQNVVHDAVAAAEQAVTPAPAAAPETPTA